jgi:cytochrome c553
MKSDPAWRNPGRLSTAPRQRLRHVSVWLTVALIACLLVLVGHSAAAQSERGVEVIELAMALEPNLRRGGEIYQQHCEACHGKAALGNAAEIIPALAGQIPLYLVKELVDLADGNRSLPEMHRVVARKSLTKPQALRDVATYLSKLPPNPQPEVGDGAQLGRGKQFYDGLCAFCHGPQGEGNAEHATPSLQRQHYSYLLAQMRQMAVGHRYSVDIVVIEKLEALPFGHLEAIADYAARLPDKSAVGGEDP